MKSDFPAGTRVDGAYVAFHFMDEKVQLETVVSVPLNDNERAHIRSVFERIKANLGAGGIRPMTEAEIKAFRDRIAASIRPASP